MKKLAIIFSVAIFLVVSVALFLPKEEKDKVYFIASKKTDSMTDAISFAAKARQKGGAGYLYKDGSEIYVLLMGYREKSDAEKVLENLPDDYFSVSLAAKAERAFLSDELFVGIVALDVENDELSARECVLSIAKKLGENNSPLYNLAMKTYCASKESLSAAVKYLFVAILLEK